MFKAVSTARKPVVRFPIRSIDLMKQSKDVVNGRPSLATIQWICDAAANMNVTHLGIAIPFNTSAEFTSFGNNGNLDLFWQNWCNSIHNVGLNVMVRGTYCEFEKGSSVNGVQLGIYNFPFYVTGGAAGGTGDGTGGFRSRSWWLNRLQARIATLAGLGCFLPGDVLAPFAEPQSNQNFFDSNWNFLGTSNDPTSYANFFLDAKAACDAGLASAGVTGVFTGFTSENASLVLPAVSPVSSGQGGGNWVPYSYYQTLGFMNIDHYGTDQTQGVDPTGTVFTSTPRSPEEMFAGLDAIHAFYQVPIFQQEWSDSDNRGAAYVWEMLSRVQYPLFRTGRMFGFNYWDPGVGNGGGLFNGWGYGQLTDVGRVVQEFFAAVS